MPFKSKLNNDFSGGVSYGHNVVMSIISLAAGEIKGVESLEGKGVRTSVMGDTINVDVFLNVLHNVSCSEVAYRVQENIKRSVESMTKYKVGAINVNILNVVFNNQAK